MEWTAWGISLTYSKNKSGPKIDPWGTPQEILDKYDKWLLILTLNAQSDKYDLNHATVFSEKLIEVIYCINFSFMIYCIKGLLKIN